MLKYVWLTHARLITVVHNDFKVNLRKEAEETFVVYKNCSVSTLIGSLRIIKTD